MRITERLRAAFRHSSGPSRAELAYLNAATSHSNLERRHREIDRGHLTNPRFPR